MSAAAQPRMLVEVERDAIIAALRYTHGDKTRAAALLGISYSSVYRKIESYEIRPEEYAISVEVNDA